MGTRNKESLPDSVFTSFRPAWLVFSGVLVLCACYWLPTSHSFVRLLAAGLAGSGLLCLLFGLCAGRRVVRPVLSEKPRRDPVLGRLPGPEILDEAPASRFFAKYEPVLPVETPSAARPEWSIELMRSLAPPCFAELCRQFYEAKGMRTECTAFDPEGGIELRLFPGAAGGVAAIVQARATEGEIGVGPLRSLLARMAGAQVGKAFCMTNGHFSEAARAFAAPHPITLLDGRMFLMMIQRLPVITRQQLLAIASAGEFAIPGYAPVGHQDFALAYRWAA